ncbi:MAG: hypothetical protein Q7R58_01150 [bacterium]|nr:hypothetical protein [bacterium]
MNALFIPLATLIEWCDEINDGDRETFGIINPGDGIPLENWPIAANGQNGLPVFLSLQDIVDSSEESYPDYPLEKIVIFLQLESDDDGETLSFVPITKEAVRDMRKESLH